MELCNSITQKWNQTDPCKDTLQSGKTEFNETNRDVYCQPCQLSGYQPALLILYKQLCNWFPSISCRGAKKNLFLLLSLSPCHPPWEWIGVRGNFWDHLKRVDQVYKCSRWDQSVQELQTNICSDMLQSTCYLPKSPQTWSLGAQEQEGQEVSPNQNLYPAVTCNLEKHSQSQHLDHWPPLQKHLGTPEPLAPTSGHNSMVSCQDVWHLWDLMR